MKQNKYVKCVYKYKPRIIFVIKSQEKVLLSSSQFFHVVEFVVIFNRTIIQQLLVCVSGVPATKRDEVKTNKGESVTLDSGETRKPNHVMTWFFKDSLIAQMTGDRNKTCTDVQCHDGGERFRDRVKVNQTGSLTITNTTITDSGVYKLEIIVSDSSFNITRVKRFSVNVTGE